MATGTVLVFDEGNLAKLVSGWEPADEIWLGLVTDSPSPVVAATVPAYASGGTTNYTAIATAGAYAAGGVILDTIANMYTEAAGLVTFDDTGATVVWTKNASSPQTAYWGIIYHKTSGLAIAFLELGGPIDMQAGDLTITWHASGIFTVGR